MNKCLDFFKTFCGTWIWALWKNLYVGKTFVDPQHFSFTRKQLKTDKQMSFGEHKKYKIVPLIATNVKRAIVKKN